MASTSIRRRETKTGPRFQVRYRLGGRAYPLVHAGSFALLKEAKTRRDFVAGELAAGRNPADALRALLTPSAPIRVETLREFAPRYEASRIDIAPETLRSLRSALKKISEWGGDRDPHSLTWGDCQEFVGSLAHLKPGSLRRYMDTFKTPARLRRLRSEPRERQARKAAKDGQGRGQPADR